jgi:hypothetical protein
MITNIKMNNRLIVIFKNWLLNISIFRKHRSLTLGRWNVEKCTKKIDRKIDLSNEDHCGPCGIYFKGNK